MGTENTNRIGNLTGLVHTLLYVKTIHTVYTNTHVAPIPKSFLQSQDILHLPVIVGEPSQKAMFTTPPLPAPPQDIPIQEMRSAQFYKLFLAPTVRASFVDYDALAILDWDIIIAQDMSFKMLYSAAFTADQSYWVKGSRLAEMSSEEKFASPELLGQLPAYLDGNAIYNNTDREFVDFVHFSLNRWKFTRS